MVKDITVTSAINNSKHNRVLNSIRRQFMKVSDISVTNVIIRQEEQIVLGNINRRCTLYSSNK